MAIAWGRANWPGSVPSSPQSLYETPLLVEVDNAVVAVAVGDEDVTIGQEGHIGGPVEVALIATFLAGLAEREKAFSFGLYFWTT